MSTDSSSPQKNNHVDENCGHIQTELNILNQAIEDNKKGKCRSRNSKTQEKKMIKKRVKRI